MSMLEDGFRSDNYGGVLCNLRENGFLQEKEVENLLKEFMTTQKITMDFINSEKAKIVSEALMDNYNRHKLK